MKKLVYNKFGGVDVLEVIDAQLPEIKPDSILIKVKAAAINPVDWKFREGQLKLLTGRKFPQGQGLEFSGVIEKIGSDVTQFQVGDEVFGAADNSIAEYTVAKASKIWKKPSSISFEQASTIPIVGVTGLSVFEKLATNITKETEILINGATGGIGMFVTQMAKNRGAKVTAVISSKGIDLVKKWGVDHIIDYKVTNILESNNRYDVIVELSDKLSFTEGKKLLKEKGVFIASLPKPKEIITGLINNLFSKRKYKLIGSTTKQSNLEFMAKEIENTRLDIVIGKTFVLSEFKEAYTETAKGKYLGKVVFTFNN